jgi:hypothetical protein
MSWAEIFLNKQYTDDEIIEAVSVVFGVSSELIRLQHEELDISIVGNEILVVCGLFSWNGEFPILLEIAPLRKSLLPSDRYNTLGKICEQLNAHGLTLCWGDSSYWDMTLVRKFGDYQRVIVDPVMYDEENPRMKIAQYLEKLDEPSRFES